MVSSVYPLERIEMVFNKFLHKGTTILVLPRLFTIRLNATYIPNHSVNYFPDYFLMVRIQNNSLKEEHDSFLIKLTIQEAKKYFFYLEQL